jgi:subtilisin
VNTPERRSRNRRLALAAVLAVLAGAIVAVAAVFALRDDDDEPRPDVVTTTETEPGPATALVGPDVPEPATTATPPPGTQVALPEEPTSMPEATPTPDATWEQLTEKAEARGTVPLLVTFRSEIRPEGFLTAAARSAQRQRLAGLASRVLDGLAGRGFSNIKRFTTIPVLAFDASPTAVRVLRRLPGIVSVAEDVALPVPEPGGATTSPPSAAAASGLQDWWDIYRTETNTAWSKGWTGRGQTVAILDTGVERNHTWLAGRVVSEACFSELGNCPGGGKVRFGAGSARPCAYAPDNCGHGTHVAHTAAGKYGVAPSARIIAIQVFSRFRGESNCGRGRTVCALARFRDQLAGLERVLALRGTFRIAAANMSLGGGKYGRYCDAQWPAFVQMAKHLRSYGIGTIISSGNDAFGDGIGMPACFSPAISVGGSSLAGNQDSVWICADRPRCGSNSAPILNLLAPGDHICSAVPNNRRECWRGTSMASPHVAGAFAALRQLRPQASVTAIQNAITCSGTPVGDARNGVRRARLNVWRALIALNSGC